MSNSPPRLAFVYHPWSFGVYELARAAEGVCRLVWIVDRSVAEVEAMVPLLLRLGEIVDVSGASVDEAARRVAASRPDGLLALRDNLLPWSARIAERLELEFIAPAVAEALADKYAQRSAMAAAGLPVPGYWRIPAGDGDDGWGELAAQARFPALMKPRSGLGSRDVVRVESIQDLRREVGSIADPVERAHLLLEEYLRDRPSDQDGVFAGYVSVESIVSDGRTSHLAITGRFPPAEPFRETGFFIPDALSDDDRRQVLETASATIAALGLTHGCVHTEIKLTPDGARAIELNGRMGGGTPEMLAAVTDIDLLGISMRLALGERVVFDQMPRASGVVYVLYAHAPVSMSEVLAVDGLDRLRRDPRVERVLLNRGPGHSVDWREGNWDHVFSVHGVVADHAQLAAVARAIDGETRIHGR
ncbi:MAG: ATP-grasp domain-containing protein [Solirubrobacteraceae bacterium]